MSPLDIIPGGTLTAIAAAVVAALLGAWRVYAAGENSGRNEQKAKEAEARLKAVKHKKELDNEVDTLGADELVARFRRWVRDR